VEHGEGGGFNGAPEPDDTSLDTLGDEDRAAIQSVAEELGLARMSPQQAIGAVQRFFASRFGYSLWQRPRRGATNASPLALFLLQSRSGHCEYFATATALLLRTAGVPTRYAVGYSPADHRNQRWMARGRDAHAWCLVHANGQWRDFDTTPGLWREREAAQAAWWEGLRDAFSNVRYHFDHWRQGGGNWRIVIFTGSLAILAWLAWKQLRGSRWRRAQQAGSHAALSLDRLGLDSELLGVLQRLETLHGSRLSHETPMAWLHRLHLHSEPLAGPLFEALRLHDRLRFDPRGLPAADRRRLRELSGRIGDQTKSAAD
jgi:hypothetical protein